MLRAATGTDSYYNETTRFRKPHEMSSKPTPNLTSALQRLALGTGLVLALSISAPVQAGLSTDLPLELPAQNSRNVQPSEMSRPGFRPEISPREAARIAQARNGGGRVLAVRLMPERRSYRVKLIKDGEVRVLNVPAQ